MKARTEFLGWTAGSLENLDDGHSKALKIFSKQHFDRVLDVGQGDGNFSCLLRDACGAQVFGVDCSQNAVDMANKKGVQSFCLNINEDRLPFENNFFDAVFAGYVIEHVFDSDHFFEEVYRVLKPDGLFVLSTPNLASFYNRISLFFGFQPFSSSVSLRHNLGHLVELDSIVTCADHIRLFTVKSLIEMLRRYGFRIKKKVGVRIPSGYYSDMSVKIEGRKAKLISRVDSVFSKFSGLSYAVLVCCRKTVS